MNVLVEEMSRQAALLHTPHLDSHKHPRTDGGAHARVQTCTSIYTGLFLVLCVYVYMYRYAQTIKNLRNWYMYPPICFSMLWPTLICWIEGKPLGAGVLCACVGKPFEDKKLLEMGMALEMALL